MAISGLRRMFTRLALSAGTWALVVGMTASAASAAPVPVPGPGGDRSGVARYFSGPQGFAIPTVPCDPAGPSATDGILADQLNPQLQAKMAGYMDAYKVSCARMVTQAVKDRGLNQRAATIAIATVIVESSLNNYAQAVDYTSLGLFQQQDWWGSRDERLNPAYATNAFFDEVERMYPGGSWNNEAIGEVCWQVQRPREDLRGLYAVEADDAMLIANALWSGTGATGPKHPYASGRVTTGRSADGRLEAVAAGADGVYHAWQTSVNGGWSQWRFEGGPRNAQLAVAANADGRLEVFALSDSTFDHMWQTAPGGNWSAWGNFGGGGYRLAAGNNADGRIEVFASNATGVFHRWQTAPSGGWANWEGVGGGGPANSRLAVETAPDGRLEVFALSDSTFEHLYQTGVNGGWSAWENFGGGGHDLAAGYNQDGRLEVFASNANGVFHRWQTGPASWSDWAGMGGISNAELTVSRSADGRVEVYAINANAAGHAWQTRPNAAFSEWATFGGGGTEIATGNNADGRIEVFATSHAGVYHKWQTGFATWSDWAWLNDGGPAVN
ncbi:peptidase M23 [Streptomyces sp. 4.24]|uniref:peptidase M23 n=1 Tax=Streptomyces tritrimontium TaxID=3406573 RepID=UPI003BB624AA